MARLALCACLLLSLPPHSAWAAAARRAPAPAPGPRASLPAAPVSVLPPQARAEAAPQQAAAEDKASAEQSSENEGARFDGTSPKEMPGLPVTALISGAASYSGLQLRSPGLAAGATAAPVAAASVWAYGVLGPSIGGWGWGGVTAGLIALAASQGRSLPQHLFMALVMGLMLGGVAPLLEWRMGAAGFGPFYQALAPAVAFVMLWALANAEAGYVGPVAGIQLLARVPEGEGAAGRVLAGPSPERMKLLADLEASPDRAARFTQALRGALADHAYHKKERPAVEAVLRAAAKAQSVKLESLVDTPESPDREAALLRRADAHEGDESFQGRLRAREIQATARSLRAAPAGSEARRLAAERLERTLSGS